MFVEINDSAQVKGGNDLFVKNLMKPKEKTIYVKKGDPVADALEILQKYGIDGMPVLDGDQFGGMLTLNAIYKAFFESGRRQDEFMKDAKVEDVAFGENLLIDETEVFENTLLLVKDSPLVAVANQNKQVIGVVTRSDILEQFQSAFGMKKAGVRISFTASEAEGRLARLAEITKQFQENIISLATFDETDRLVRRIVMKVEKKQSINRFIKRLEKAGFRILDIKEQ